MSPLRSALNLHDDYSGFGVSFGGVNEAEEMTMAHAQPSRTCCHHALAGRFPRCACASKNHRAIEFTSTRASNIREMQETKMNFSYQVHSVVTSSYLSFDNLAVLGNVPSVLYRDALRLKGETAQNDHLQQAKPPETTGLYLIIYVET